MAWGILVPQPGIEPTPLAVKAPSPSHWTAGEFPRGSVLIFAQYTAMPINFKRLHEASLVVKNPPANAGETRVRALVREDPTCRGATKPVRHNY